MTTCPPTAQTQFDVRNPASCVQLCSLLLQAYYNVIAGQGRVTVRFQERWTEYQKGNVKELREQYMVLYTQCPAAKAAGLPNINPMNAVRRGAPARGLQIFPRL
jgi:hypothetical protein